MIASIMQPYFFPYIGYFQLMRAVDVFVVYDDVQYMKGGWVNRNRILAHGAPSWFTLPVKRDSVSLRIDQREYVRQPWVRGLQRQLQASYAKAPHFGESFPLIRDLLEREEVNVAVFNTHLLTALAAKLRIDCRFVISSGIDKPPDLKGQDRVIDLCHRIGADRYVNPPGGQALYDDIAFEEAGIELSFLRSTPTSYQQFGTDHVPFLSIIDVLMFNSVASTGELLDRYRLAGRDEVHAA